MKLKNIFAAATVCLGLSFGAVFSSNAALITQEFTFDGGSIEVGVLSENGIDDGSDVFVWDIDSYEFINLRFTDDLVLIDNGFDLVAIEAGEYFSQDGSLVLTAVGDIFASVPPDANGNPDFFSTDGFFEFGFQAELFDLGIGDFDLFDFNIYESTGFSFSSFDAG